jgi:beta-lactamase class A
LGGGGGGQALAWGVIFSLLTISSSGGQAAQAAGFGNATPQQAPPAAGLMTSSAAPLYDAGLGGLINSYVAGEAGNWAIFVKKLDTGQWATFQSNQRLVSASLYKLFVMYEVYRQWDAGNLNLDERWRITNGEAAEDIAIDNLYFAVGSQWPISTLLGRMIGYSDNTAGAALVDRVGLNNINRTLQNIGLTDSRLDFTNDNITTANDVAELLERIALGRAISPEASQQMLNLLLDQQINDLIPQGVPTTVPIAHKTGTLDSLRHDAAIVYGPSGPYIFVAMSTNLPSADLAYNVVPRLSTALYSYFNDHPSQPTRFFPATGQFVASPFLRFWNTYGGAQTLGAPLGPAEVTNGYTVQWFEKGRLGLPDGPATPDRVEVGTVGLEVLSGRRYDPQPDPDDPNSLWFQATGQVIKDPFLSYWQTHGGVRLFGNPISPVLNEEVTDAGTIPVQYFERARLELHGNQVQVGDLGRLLMGQ